MKIIFAAPKLPGRGAVAGMRPEVGTADCVICTAFERLQLTANAGIIA
ncbi:MAG: hypothetical protein IIC53_01915 [Proteobacteria bacterium]|nr:hypothetical protein [Pseudomonadota bacterium]